LIDDRWNHGIRILAIGFVAIQEICKKGVSQRRAQKTCLPTLEAVIFGALHTLPERFDAYVVIYFEASMQVM
jgi:hypothetical protein